jgi:transcription initiation factor TFIIIB Brf1 subunit/transcription initiation factor TFIIB
MWTIQTRRMCAENPRETRRALMAAAVFTACRQNDAARSHEEISCTIPGQYCVALCKA